MLDIEVREPMLDTDMPTLSSETKPRAWLVYVVGVPGSGKSTLMEMLIREIEAAQDCAMIPQLQGGGACLPWLQGVVCGAPVVLVGRWAGKHPMCAGNGEKAADGGMIRGQGADRVPPGVGTRHLMDLLPSWRLAGVRMVVADSILPKVLCPGVVSSAVAAGFEVVVIELDTPLDECTKRWKLRESTADPQRLAQVCPLIEKMTKKWLLSANPWRSPPLLTEGKVYKFVYVLVDIAAALQLMLSQAFDDDEDNSTTPNMVANIREVSPIRSTTTAQSCGGCGQLLLGAPEVRYTQCIGCLTQFHETCVPKVDEDHWWLLCIKCRCQLQLCGHVHTNKLRISEPFAGIHTCTMAAIDLELAQLLNRVANVWGCELEHSCNSFADLFSQQPGYDSMRASHLYTNILHTDSFVPSDTPHVHIMAIAPPCVTHSPQHNGHVNHRGGLDDPQTVLITNALEQLLGPSAHGHRKADIVCIENTSKYWQGAGVRVLDAAFNGGYRLKYTWKFAGPEVGLCQTRRRIIQVLYHECAPACAEPWAKFETILQQYCAAESEDAITLEGCVLRPRIETPADELCLEDCGIGETTIKLAHTLRPADVEKLSEIRTQIQRGELVVGDWAMADLANSSLWGYVNRTGNAPTVLASHGARTLFHLNPTVNRFTYWPEHWILQGYPELALRVAAQAHGETPSGEKALFRMAGNATPYPAYRVLLQALADMRPDVMRPLKPPPVEHVTLSEFMTHDECAQLMRGKYIVHPNGDKYARRDYASHVRVSSLHWDHIYLSGEQTYIFHVPGGEVVVHLNAMQRAGINPREALGVALSSPDHVVTDMAPKRSIHSVGFIAQPGVRYRLWEPCESARKVQIAANKDRLAYLKYIHRVQRVCNGMLEGTLHSKCEILERDRANLLERMDAARACGLHVGALPGAAAKAFPSVQIGINCGAAMHLDEGDNYFATWGCVGDSIPMALGECNTMLHMPPGAVVEFDSTSIWHCMVRVPPELFNNANFSCYFNSTQLRELRKQNENIRNEQGR